MQSAFYAYTSNVKMEAFLRPKKNYQTVRHRLSHGREEFKATSSSVFSVKQEPDVSTIFTRILAVKGVGEM
jgi:hypothetical protein